MATQKFTGRAGALSQPALERIAGKLGVGTPALWAVLKVETSGCGFLPDRRPKILFERHCFHRFTRGRFDRQAPDLSDEAAGGYGAAGANQYKRLLRAIDFDHDAALQSVSWGLGQVMGFNAGISGFDNAAQLAHACMQGEDGQLEAMAAFIVHNKLHRHLQRADWAAFAQGYNGPSYRINAYDTKLASAHFNYETGGTPDLAVRQLQLALMLAGMDPGNPVDGEMGNRTREQVRLFQVRDGLPPTGNADTTTRDALWIEAGWSEVAEA